MKRIFILLYIAYCFTYFSCSFESNDLKKEYADSSVLYNGRTYNGRKIGGNKILKQDSSFKLENPDSASFYADAFFSIKGIVKNSAVYNYALIQVSKTGTELTAKYFPRNNFDFRIWLPFGEGKYTVNIYKLIDIDIHRVGEGNISGVSYDKTNPIYTFEVFNTRNEDGRFLYPSYFIQSDNEEIQAEARKLCKGKKNDIEIIEAVHDYVCLNCSYDYESSKAEDEENKLYRKQDAKTVFDTQLAVCEGYSSLTAALLRASGIKTKAVIGTLKFKPSSNPAIHAWLNVLCEKDGITKYRLLDPTNNDNEIVDTTKNFKFIEEQPPLRTYFLLDIENNEKNNNKTHLQGKKNEHEIFSNEDGLFDGTRPWR